MAKRVKIRLQKPKKKSRLLLIIFIAIIVLALLFFSTRLYLALNLLLGNDIVVKLSSDKDNLNLQHYQSEEIEFSAYILTNPLCSAECTSEFTDLSGNALIEKETFTLKPAITKSKEYTITAAKFGKGQDVYRFDIVCKGISTFWCHTSEQNRTRSIIITLNYDLNNEETELKNSSKIKIEASIQNSNLINAEIESINLTISNLSSIDTSSFSKELKEIKLLWTEYNNSAYNLKKEWENQNYSIPEDTVEINSKLNELNLSISQNISAYNLLIDNLTVIRQNLERLNALNLSNESLIQRDNAIISFNNVIDLFNNKSSIQEKEGIIMNISVPQLINEENESSSSIELKQIPSKIQAIEIQPTQIELIFKEPAPTCCLFGKCEACCTNCSSANYPVILLHGHAFNKKISAEYSLETFQEIQGRLEKDGYLNAGSILISPKEQEGVWSVFNLPLSVRVSYYFDVYKNPKESSVIQTKSDSLDSYALRLKDIIDIVKYKTGKDKVIIISHSMGGLVARRYLQIFGDSDISKLIMVASPNHGIESNILNFCSIIGESLECRDMAKESLFVNKLNYGKTPSIPIYKLIGTGCKMGNEIGDGIVTKSSAYLENSRNYEIKGNCTELKFEFLHDNMLNPDSYPKAYEFIIDALKD